MYAHLFSVRFQKWRHSVYICFLTPMITLFWPISLKLCKIGCYHYSHIGRVNPGHTGSQWPISPNIFKITTELLLVMHRKSYMRFH